MATTAEGDRLTREHMDAQARLGELAAAMTIKNARDRLNPYDLDGSRERWMLAQVAITRTLRRRSEVLARAYLTAFREAERVPPDDIAAPDPMSVTDALEWVVPWIKARTAKHAAEAKE